LPVRNAVIVEGKTGEWVKAEFDTDAIGELFVQMIVSELPENEDFEHMTPEELSAIFSRFPPPGG
jgi:hypothetical protein